MTPPAAPDPALTAVGALTGPETEKRAARAACGVMLIIAAVTGALIFLTGCMTASGPGWKTAAVGTDAARYKVGPEGLEVEGLNQSKSLEKVADTIQKMWSGYLKTVGFKWGVDKYFDHQNNLVNADTTLKLEQLRNAKSVADAEAALKTLQATQAAEAAAAGAAAVPVP